jgi:uncharacterized cupin superfamily protein
VTAKTTSNTTTYSSSEEINYSVFVPFDTQANGAIKVEGNINAKMRVDFEGENAVGGLFTQKPGKVEIIWPATEHAFVLEGEVTILYHDTGISKTYRPGDGWTIKRGEHIMWEVKSGRFTKSFFSIIGND